MSLIDKVWEHGSKVLAAGSIASLIGYLFVRKRIWAKKAPVPLLQDDKSTNVLRICLTGGPCAGKTTAMDMLYGALTQQGINTYIVPEAATLIADSGGMLNTKLYSSDELMEFQYNLLKAQILLETSFLEIARNDSTNHKTPRLTVVLCDRGLMDGKAYMSKELWENMLKTYQIRESDMRDRRYDAIFHLVTAADGAPLHYTTANNDARSETVDEAVDLDGRTRQAWFGHPNLITFDNTSVGSFHEKLQKVVDTLLDIVRQHRAKYNLH